MASYKEFKRTINGSMRYEIDDYGQLTVTDYYTGKATVLNLNWLTEDMFNALVDNLASDEDE